MLTISFIVVLNIAHVWSDMEGRVVHGRLTRIHRHPHSVYLFMHDDTSNSGYMCGGSIVNQRVVLTAAHCFEGVTKTWNITANVGSTHQDKGRQFIVNSVKMHPKYDTINIINDIALAGLDKSIVFGLKSKRIVLARQKRSEGMAKMAGWGVVEEFPQNLNSKYLHEVSVPYMSRKICKKIYKKMDKGTFCGGKLRASSHPSVGDSGSPLVVKNYIQIGLVSYKNNLISRSMIIYTDVPYFYEWITENAKSVYCKKEYNIPNFNNSQEIKSRL